MSDNYGPAFDRKMTESMAKQALDEVRGSIDRLVDDDDSILEAHVANSLELMEIVDTCRAFEVRIMPLIDTLERRIEES